MSLPLKLGKHSAGFASVFTKHFVFIYWNHVIYFTICLYIKKINFIERTTDT